MTNHSRKIGIVPNIEDVAFDLALGVTGRSPVFVLVFFISVVMLVTILPKIIGRDE
jgi:hypothetical protein